jgi:ATP-dependent DNA helicase RecQ
MQKSPEHILKKYWGFSSFKGSQRPIIESLMNGHNIMALMPTGGGKSVCFQVPAIAKEGICIVVSPLIALIQNQVQVLKQKGIKAIGLTGGISHRDLDVLLDNCIHGNYKFLYLSPERLQQPLVKARIQQMPVNLIAIDEAHCISEWGHDFRPAYRQCYLLSELHPDVPVIALTATATKKVVEDVLLNLRIPEAIVHSDSFERKNITFSVENRQDKIYAVNRAFEGSTKSGILYVRSRKDTVLLSNTLNKNGQIATYFHGGLTSFEKKKKLNAWLNNEVRIMVATNAFGMGVDKPDVETVVHYQLPDSIENYYQEAGRAGRNDQPAQAIVLVNQNDVERAKRQFLDSIPDIAFVKRIYQKLNTFLQIAYNEGTNEDYYLNFNVFCERYELHPSKTYSTLKLLDQNGVLSLVETSHEMNTIQFVARKEELFTWIRTNDKMGHILQVLLRTYGGVFEFETKINLALLAKKANESQQYVHQTLVKLEKDRLVTYKDVQHDLKLIFLKPREDEKTINPIAPNIKKLNQTKQQKLQMLLAYVENNSTCRSEFLLQYFGEKETRPCGACDICNDMVKTKTPTEKTNLKVSILKALKAGEKTSRELARTFDFEETDLLHCLKELLEDEKLILKPNNTYGIK